MKDTKGNHEQGMRALQDILATLSGSGGGLVVGAFHHIGGKGPNDDHKEWAKILRVREESGEHLSIAQQEAWRDALGSNAQ